MLQVTVNKQYYIIANISIDDVLRNDAHCCIKYIQCKNSKSSISSIIWVQFEDPDIGKQQKQKYKFFNVYQNKDKMWTPIFATECKFPVKKKKQWITRIQFPL